MSFKALVVEQDEDGKKSVAVQELDESRLRDGEVTVAVEYSTLNYKDGMCMGNSQGLVRNYPHVPGVDFAGTVETSKDSRYKAGDKVVLTGWRVGEAWWGGYAQKACVKADWLVPLPDGISTHDAMAIGTAGFTAMLSVLALEQHGLQMGNGPVLVTGASGGVGSVATAILAQLGHEVTAVTGRPETGDYLKQLGANELIAREDINTLSDRPLEAEQWVGCIDSVGGDMLGRVIGQIKRGGSIAAVGLVGGVKVTASVMPFLLRGINLLGIDSVSAPYEKRVQAWQRLAKDLPMDILHSMVTEATLHDLPDLGKAILAGKVKGRVVVDVNADKAV